ncbi:hypothetical protein [Nocardia salmonicida]|uniref:hypothetical protein n=1 Tax=Nocardia salmonicida TaxID=53431 RepID=UPI0034009B5D
MDSDRRPIDEHGGEVGVLGDQVQRRGGGEGIAAVMRMRHRQFDFPKRQSEQQHQERGRKPSSPNPTDQSHSIKIATDLCF